MFYLCKIIIPNTYLFICISGFPRLYHLIPDGEITSIKINRTDPNENLAIRIVGGSETPLVHIIIQHIYRDGAIARDARLLPGDMILKVLYYGGLMKGQILTKRYVGKILQQA